MKRKHGVVASLVRLSVFTLLLVAAVLGSFFLKASSWEQSSKRQPSESAGAIGFDITKTPTPFQPVTDTPTLTASPTVTRTSLPSKTPTVTPTFTSTATSTVTATPTPLNQASIERIKGRWAAYSLSCEARSAVDWAAYFGVRIDEITFFNHLPVSDDPEIGFVGDVNASWGSVPPDAYGVHAKPVAALLRKFGADAVSVKGMSWDRLQAEISQGRPVIAWVVGRVGLGTPITYISSTGRQTTVARFEHTVIVTGYTRSEVTVLDGYWTYTRIIQDFLASWSVLGNMAVVWAEN